MIKRWNEFPKKKPQKDGWYQCTVKFLVDEKKNQYQSYVMDLYYYVEDDKWRDNRRQEVFNIYEVYGYCEGPNGTTALERVYTGNCCIRDDVIAWKLLPKPYEGGR